jgi:PIH1 N-terminal domain
LSLGNVREDNDKKGELAQVYDVIWNPKTIERCKTDPSFRQVVVELAFNHIH